MQMNRAIVLSYPVNNEDLADAKLVLELLGGYGYRIEVTESPDKHRRRENRGVKDSSEKSLMLGRTRRLF